jgi:hypothetical protein
MADVKDTKAADEAPPATRASSASVTASKADKDTPPLADINAWCTAGMYQQNNTTSKFPFP